MPHPKNSSLFCFILLKTVFDINEVNILAYRGLFPTAHRQNAVASRSLPKCREQANAVLTNISQRGSRATRRGTNFTLMKLASVW